MSYTSRFFVAKVVVPLLFILGTTAWGGSLLRTPLDFDGDGHSDLAVYDPSAATWYIEKTNGTVLAWGLQWGFVGGECVAGDFDGDGVTDLGIYDPRAGKWYIRNLRGTVLAWGLSWGFSSGEAVIDDFDGDGKDDLGIYDTQTGLWYIRSLAGNVQMWGVQWGYNGCEPLSASFNGTNATPMVFDDQTRQFYPMGRTEVYNVYGGSEKELVVGNINGFGVDVFGTYDANGGYWYLSSPNAIGAEEPWGFKGGVPLVGDYNGDGYSDYAIYNTATGGWYIKSSFRNILAWDVRWGGRGLVPVGRRMANPAVDFSTLRFGDTSAAYSITSITVTDLERGTVYHPTASSTLNLLPGGYEIAIGWYGSVREGIIIWYRGGTGTQSITVEPRRAYQILLNGGSISSRSYTAPSVKCIE